MVPEMSSRHSAIRAIMARAESLTALGAMPSAQLIVLSAVAFDDAVRDHFQNAMAHLMKKARGDLGETRSAGHGAFESALRVPQRVRVAAAFSRTKAP